MTSTKNKLTLTQKDFDNNWANSQLLNNLRYCSLVWVEDILYCMYTATMSGEEIEILVN